MAGNEQIGLGRRRSGRGITKQISIFIDIEDWRRLRLEAAKQRLPMTELCRRQLAPLFRRIRNAAVR